MRVIIIGNSPIKSFKNNYSPEENDYFITCDKGIKELRNYNPNLAIGDFDSGGKILSKNANQTKVFPAKKDQTDLELALMEVKNLKNVSKIIIYDAGGARTDHYLINLKLIAKYQKKYQKQIILINQKEVIKFLTKGNYIIENDNYQYLSIINFEETLITLENVEYPLNNYLLTKENTLTSSNKFLSSDAIIKIHSGEVYLILTK